MSTTERGLFDELGSYLCNAPRALEIIAKFEQRLAEAERMVETKHCDAICFRDIHIKAQEEIAQLRARCGELENIVNKANAVNEHWNEFGYEHGFDERMDHLHSALTATPQPAQEQTTK